MSDSECVEFLQWALPRLGLRWPGFRKVRKQVCKRIGIRLKELGSADLDAYRRYLEANPREWDVLDSFCRISISRFYRDRDVFDFLGSQALPHLAEAASASQESEVRAWSAGCASGEEPYSLSMLWQHSLRCQAVAMPLRIVATDVDPGMLARARRGCYAAGSLKDLPPGWRGSEFVPFGELFRVCDERRAGIEFRLEDIRIAQPAGPFHLILCRYLVFTYFEPHLQARLLAAMADRLAPAGVLVTGKRELLPEGVWGLAPLAPRLGVYQKVV